MSRGLGDVYKRQITEDSCKMGYVGAFPYAEVISGYTSFYLGAKSVCPSVTMEVKYTNSWASFDLEKECADALISDGCVLISQHADTTGAPTACEAAGVPCVIGKNGVEEILEVELTDEEQAKFAASCDILRGFLDRAASLKF